MGVAHLWRAGQHTCRPPGPVPFTQQERFFGQQPASPQQRDVRRSQHLLPHSSSFCLHRLQRPVRSLMQCQRGGQHLLLPHQARFGGQRCSQTSALPVPTRIVRHSSFALQHRRPQPRCPILQHFRQRGVAQNSSGPQQEYSSPQVLMHMQLLSPRLPQRVPGGQLTAPLLNPSDPLTQQQVEPATPQVSKQPAYGPPSLSFLQIHGTGKGAEQVFSQNWSADDGRCPPGSAEGRARAPRLVALPSAG
jgi:hypothetical protein